MTKSACLPAPAEGEGEREGPVAGRGARVRAEAAGGLLLATPDDMYSLILSLSDVAAAAAWWRRGYVDGGRQRREREEDWYCA